MIIIAYLTIVFLLTLAYVFLFLFYLVGWNMLPEFKSSSRQPSTRVSVVIAARNEEANIRLLLLDLLKQDFPPHLLEIIVVDDFSQDQTTEIVSSFSSDQIKLLQLSEFVSREEIIFSYKKKAIETGIKYAEGELIITTDADCRINTRWIQMIVNFYEERQCHMVVAPVLMSNEKRFFSKFQSLDFIGLIGITGATLQLNFPTMCNGANLAFRKSSFNQVNGYEGISKKTSGDDMLLMHKMAREWKNGVQFLKNRDAVVVTHPESTLFDFMRQRMRWTSKSRAYSDKRIQWNLAVVLLFNFSMIATLVISFFSSSFFILLMVQLFNKVIVDFAFLSRIVKFFRRQQLMWIFLPVEILHIFYIVIAGFAGNLFTVRWKGRTVK